MTYIPGADYFVHYVPFPEDNGTDGGCVTTNDDGTFSILLDERLLGQPILKKTFKHEVKHITDEDFYNDKPIREVEGF